MTALLQLQSFRQYLLAGMVLVPAVLLASAEPPGEAEIARLIKQLEAPRFDDREAAARRLEELGPVALPALREAMQSRNPAVAQRAALIVQVIEQRGDARDILQPTMVELNVVDSPIESILVQLSAKAQVQFDIPDELRGRKVAFNTAGQMPFWRAVEQLAQEVGFALQQSNIGEQVLKVVPGKPPEAQSCHLGAIWLRLRPAAPRRNDVITDERRFILEVYTEPKLRWKSDVELRLVSATDNKRQEITLINAVSNVGEDDPRKSAPPAVRHDMLVRLRVAEEPGDVITHLKAQLVGRGEGKPGHLMIDDVLKAKGQVVRNQSGDQLRLLECRVNAQGTVTVRLEVTGGEQVAGNLGGLQMRMQMQMQIQINGAMQVNPLFQIQGMPGNGLEEFTLYDTEGRLYQMQGRSEGIEVVNGTVRRSLNLFFAPPTPQSRPKKLLLQSLRPSSVVVDFELKNVPL